MTLMNVIISSSKLIKAINGFGLNAYFEGRNDIFIDGYKVSGCASCRENNKILYHGTLLVDSDLDALERVLTRNNKVTSKSVKSNPKQVKNITDFVEINIEDVSQAICGDEKIHEAEDNVRIDELAHGRYNNKQWTFGFPPNFNYKNSRRFKAGQIW